MESIKYLMDGKYMFFPSLAGASIFTTIMAFITNNTPSEIFGYSITIWFAALVINVLDIYTGIKADTVEQKKLGKDFEFSPDKAAKAFEKIVIFTIIIGFIYTWEIEAVRLKYSDMLVTSLNVIKTFLFFYIMLIELKSIGNNNEVRFGTKGDVFKLLDTVINIVNEGVFAWVRKLFGIDKNGETIMKDETINTIQDEQNNEDQQ